MALGCIVQYCIFPFLLPPPCRTHPFQLPPAYLVLLTALGCGVHVLCVVYVTSKSRLRGCAYMFPLEFSDEQKDAMEKEDIVCGVAMPRLLRCLEYVLCTATHTCCTREAWWLLGGIEPMGPVQYGYCTLKKWPLRAALFNGASQKRSICIADFPSARDRAKHVFPECRVLFLLPTVRPVSLRPGVMVVNRAGFPSM